MSTNQPRLRDKIVVITGAAGGIGSALARRFVAEGARVTLLDRDQAGVLALADELNSGDPGPTSSRGGGQTTGQQAMAQACDVTSLDDCQIAIGLVVETWGGVDILVNNAGITHLGRFYDTEVDVIRRVMEVNLFGSVNATKAALDSLLARRGQIIVTSSVAGIAPLATRTGYSASKHALHGFFDSLRAEHHDDGLRVLMVCPSFVDTGIGDNALGTDGQPARVGERTGVKEPMTPEEAADLIVGATLKNRRLLLIPREAKLAYWVSRLTPKLYQRLMLKRTARDS